MKIWCGILLDKMLRLGTTFPIVCDLAKEIKLDLMLKYLPYYETECG